TVSTNYRDLVAWQQAMESVEVVYRATASWPGDEKYGLTSQVRRAVVSVVSNIAEGRGRNSRGEFLQFLGHAKGSLLEVETQILVAERLKYLATDKVAEVMKQTER